MSSKNHGFWNFMNGKGFYAALALCLVGAGTAAWVVVDKTLGSIADPGTDPSYSSEASEESSWSFPDLEEAGKAQSHIAAPSASSSSQPTESSSSAASEPASVPSEASEQQVLSPEPQILAFALPIKSAEVFNSYSNGELVKNSTLDKWCTHDGIDIKAEVGTEVLCAASGTVTRVVNDGLWGRMVEVSHGNGLTSIYCGLDPNVAVQEGDEVALQQVLGHVGETNLAELALPSHLHFAIKQDGKYVNPLQAMGKLEAPTD